MHLGLDKRLCLVTGGTQGIGYGIAETLVKYVGLGGTFPRPCVGECAPRVRSKCAST